MSILYLGSFKDETATEEIFPLVCDCVTSIWVPYVYVCVWSHVILVLLQKTRAERG